MAWWRQLPNCAATASRLTRTPTPTSRPTWPARTRRPHGASAGGRPAQPRRRYGPPTPTGRGTGAPTPRVRTFAARDPESGGLVGGCELRIRPDGTAEVSYWTHAAQRGRGHARNALALLVGYAASIGVTRLEAHVAADNRASRRVAESAGFSQAGTFTDDGTQMIRYTREAPQPPATHS